MVETPQMRLLMCKDVLYLSVIHVRRQIDARYDETEYKRSVYRVAEPDSVLKRDCLLHFMTKPHIAENPIAYQHGHTKNPSQTGKAQGGFEQDVFGHGGYGHFIIHIIIRKKFCAGT